MTGDRIYKRAFGAWILVADGRPGRAARMWCGRCGACGEVMTGAVYGQTPTRKTVRDALYHHRRINHAGPSGTV